MKNTWCGFVTILVAACPFFGLLQGAQEIPRIDPRVPDIVVEQQDAQLALFLRAVQSVVHDPRYAEIIPALRRFFDARRTGDARGGLREVEGFCGRLEDVLENDDIGGAPLSDEQRLSILQDLVQSLEENPEALFFIVNFYLYDQLMLIATSRLGVPGLELSDDHHV